MRSMPETITLTLPEGGTLPLTDEEARSLARRLWDISSYDGAVLLAANILETLRRSAVITRRIDLSSREHAALRRVLGDSPAS
jgi:hypothetical protein